MSEAVLLQQFEEKAQQIRTEAERLLADGVVAADAPWRGVFDAALEAARRVEARALAPVKIGVVGEFSAGKTLLLGSLIGYADGLPVSELPTTGNVTALNFTLVDELVSTQVGPYRITFLTHEGVEECLGYMLGQARRRAKQAELREELVDKLGAITASDPAAASKIEEWCGQAWSASTNPSMRYLVRELVGFVRAYAKCGTGLCEPGEAFEVPADQALRGLALPAVKESIQGLAFSDLPVPSAAVSARPEPITSDQIRDGFPLIRLVSVDVKVSRQVWDFSSLTGANRFVLMDFPGLGADSSGVRDLFLCLRELEQIQTILILLNGRQPGGNEGTKLYNLLQEHRTGQDIRDMILVAVGRFDQLPLQNEGGTEKLRELAGAAGRGAPPKAAAKPARSKFAEEEEDDEAGGAPAAAPTGGSQRLTEAAVLNELPVLGTCLAGAESLVPHGRRDRVVLASPMLHLRFLAESNVSIRVGSDEFLAGNRDAADHAAAVAKLWGGVAERLKADQTTAKPEAGLARWLGDFAYDGGIGRLRTLIQSHVQMHGLAQRFRDVSRDVEALRTALRGLREALPPVVAKDTRSNEDKLQAAERELRQLAELYHEMANGLSVSPRFTVTKDGAAVPLEEALHDEIVSQVCEWVQWDTLFHKSRQGYIIDRGAGGVFVDEDDEGDDGPGDEQDGALFPKRTEDFFPPFERTVYALDEFTRRLIDDGVNQWLAQLGEQTAPARLTLAPYLERKTLVREVRALRLGERGEGLVSALRAAIDPPRLKKLLFPPDGSLADLDLPKPRPADLFPLARATKDSPGRVFAWAGELAAAPDGSRPERHHAHQAMVLRLRDEVVNILRQEMAQVLSVSMQTAVERFAENLQEMSKKLSVAAANRFVLETIVRDQPAAPAGDAAPAEDALGPARRLAAVAL